MKRHPIPCLKINTQVNVGICPVRSRGESLVKIQFNVQQLQFQRAFVTWIAPVNNAFRWLNGAVSALSQS